MFQIVEVEGSGLLYIVDPNGTPVWWGAKSNADEAERVCAEMNDREGVS